MAARGSPVKAIEALWFARMRRALWPGLRRQADADGAGGGGRVSVSARSVSRVDSSAIPSICDGRKWRWKAVTTTRVASS